MSASSGLGVSNGVHKVDWVLGVVYNYDYCFDYARLWVLSLLAVLQNH